MFRLQTSIYQSGIAIYLGTRTAIAQAMGADSLTGDANGVTNLWRQLDQPEPTTWVLFAMGIFCMLLLRRHQRHKIDRRGESGTTALARITRRSQPLSRPPVPVRIHRAA